MITRDVRASIASIALAHATGGAISGLYDHDREKHLKLSASVSGDRFAGQDLERGAQLSGSFPDIYDHARSNYIHIKGENGKYVGFDHHSGTHFNIEVTGNTVSLYDHTAQSWHQYSLV